MQRSIRMPRWVAPALLAVAIPTLALAQQAQTPAPAQPQAKSDQQLNHGKPMQVQ